LLREYKEIFSDVPKVTNLIEHKVELTQREPVRCKVYPTPYTRNPAIAEGPRDAGVPVEIW